jgi:hypothetical protein
MWNGDSDDRGVLATALYNRAHLTGAGGWLQRQTDRANMLVQRYAIFQLVMMEVGIAAA